MLQPSIDSLQTKINSKYTLVTVSAQRARQLREHPEKFNQPDGAKSVNYVGMALEEIDAEQLSFELNEDDVKETI
ncbi:DNA-directed RNA polymerase subunit omega [Alkalicoccus saliphilus]|jgi:DNA-directed RNA polymerase subunit omega|uniref:DNA-directed RNA polymerase subunit omega n=1 Tax=Alkalicoccus saliphilus TaxID=200989 RepID=A0A2T4U8G0_9BACI|nr:DNA-directed RNA polymerase subunit omega [Alkalicoccus saliphilus]PTL39675.1 DNA-directed RNA polymerase subunit omega [Alkalicoccus saliphilus]